MIFGTYLVLILISWFLFARALINQPERDVYSFSIFPDPKNVFFCLYFAMMGAIFWPLTLTGWGMISLIRWEQRRKEAKPNLRRGL